MMLSEARNGTFHPAEHIYNKKIEIFELGLFLPCLTELGMEITIVNKTKEEFISSVFTK